jgi:uncharacterized protein (TIGR03118 family)
VNTNRKFVTKRIGLFFGLIGAPAMAAAIDACSSSGDPMPPSTQSFNGNKDGGADSAPAAPVVARPVLQSVDTTFLFADTADSGAVSTNGAVPRVDPNLVNSWGLAFGPTGIAWISDNGKGISTLYQPNLTAPLPAVVTIPPPAGAEAGVKATPTGVVLNLGAIPSDAGAPLDFKGDLFIFATEDGTIAGWNPTTDAFSDAGTATATKEVDNSASGSVYKGLAIVPGMPKKLVVADFHNGALALFDNDYVPITPPALKWVDPSIPAGYAPFNVVTIGGNVYVSYALQDAEKHDDVSGAGHGAISVFDPNGKLVASLVKVTEDGPLNSPWGLALAPPIWGKLGGALLVGNFGDGAIHAFDPDTGAFKGQLINPATGASLAIDGLWALTFDSQNPDAGISPDQLFFTAGPNMEKNGLFGFFSIPQ